ncbi:DNA repair protein RecN [Leucobacter sp. OH1287]|uniref:DNA repair protein RecN n=1 Tax=Leucobacter sp. OH1287 TaxID=2491049 RepID=UPI000F5F0CDB|nr:DNA repair protein RecN [Leucobacter sp. OH1287]RRD61333.1 DNA repair protein RecN [Leucobacter sp. OH1287]
MIEELTIKNLGVIASSTLPLGPGFTAITGETGAGKTMVVTALGLLMGSRSDANLVRHGTDATRVAGAIHIGDNTLTEVAEIVSDAGGEIEEGELLLSRTVAAAGNSRATVGGVRSPIGVLSTLASKLFCVHGQSDQLRLRSQSAQRETLDRFGGSAIAAALAEYQRSYTRQQQLQQQLAEITENREARAREIERLKTETEEISEAEPQPGELETLRTEIDRLTNIETLREQAATAQNLLAAESPDPYQSDATALMAEAEKTITQASQTDKTLKPVQENLAAINSQLNEVVRELSNYLDSIEGSSQAELDSAQQRYAELTQLVRKYGPNIEDVLEYLETAGARLLQLENDDTSISTLTAELAQTTEAVDTAAAKLTTLRQNAATKLSKAVSDELQHLALGSTQIVVTVEPAQQGTNGADSIEFQIKTNRDAPARTLAKSASGGELSRIMLAIEVVLAATDPVPTFVFDEIDAGIGGSAAIEVGKRLAALAKHSQVIVVTHLAQVAAFANNHLKITKDADGIYTESSCEQLTGDTRVQEIARLLSGLDDSATGLAHAKELLEMGKQQT